MIKLLFILFIFCMMTPVQADELNHNLYAHPTAKGMKIGAVFGLLPNMQTDDILLSVSSPICDHIEIHTMSEDNNGIFRMRKIENLPVKTGKANELLPSGYHLMLMNLKSPLKTGQSFPLMLTFQKAGQKTVTVSVISR